jgi:type 1 glutamine amidotransferase
VNQYGEGKVFATTIGHHNETVSTKEFLDLITNGVRWATGHK